MSKFFIYLISYIFLGTCTVANAAHPSHTSQYADQFYMAALGRAATHVEKHEMMFSESESSCTTVQFKKAGMALFSSPEFSDLDLTAAAKIQILYQTVIQQELNQVTYKSYLDSLESGMSFLLLASVLFDSEEFKQHTQKICSEQGLKQVVAVSAPAINTNNAISGGAAPPILNNEEESSGAFSEQVVVIPIPSDNTEDGSGGFIRAKARPRHDESEIKMADAFVMPVRNSEPQEAEASEIFLSTPEMQSDLLSKSTVPLQAYSGQSSVSFIQSQREFGASGVFGALASPSF